MLVVAHGQMNQKLYLEVAELSELLPALVQSASEGLDLLVDDLVRSNIAALSEGLAANVAVVWSFSGVSPFVSLAGVSENDQTSIAILTLRLPS